MKKKSIGIVISCLVIVIASVFVLKESSVAISPGDPNFYFNANWGELSEEDWGPWIEEGDETWRWNPRESYNQWVDSLDRDALAWPRLVDLCVKERVVFSSDVPFSLISEYNKEWVRPMQMDLVYISQFADQNNLAGIIRELNDIADLGYFGKRVSGYLDFEELLANEKYLGENEHELNNKFPQLIQATSYSEIGMLHSAAMLMESWGAYSLEKNDFDGYVKQVESISSFAHFAAEFPSLRRQKLAINISEICLELIVYGVKNFHKELSVSECMQMRTVLDDLVRIKYSYSGAMLNVVDNLRYSIAVRGVFDANVFVLDKGRLRFHPRNEPYSGDFTDVNLSVQKYIRSVAVINRIISLLSQKYNKTELGKLRLAYDNSVGLSDERVGLLFKLSLPVKADAFFDYLKIRQGAVATKLLLDTLLFKREHAKWPGGLKDIELNSGGLYLDSFADNGNLGILIESNSIKIYSFGPDGKDDAAKNKDHQMVRYMGIIVPSDGVRQRDGRGDWLILQLEI